jgi:hypothetical protein
MSSSSSPGIPSSSSSWIASLFFSGSTCSMWLLECSAAAVLVVVVFLLILFKFVTSLWAIILLCIGVAGVMSVYFCMCSSSATPNYYRVIDSSTEERTSLIV